MSMFSFLKSVGGREGLGSETSSEQDDPFSDVRRSSILDDFPTPRMEEPENKGDGSDEFELFEPPTSFSCFPLNRREFLSKFKESLFFGVLSNENILVNIFLYVPPEVTVKIMQSCRFFSSILNEDEKFWNPYFLNFFSAYFFFSSSERKTNFYQKNRISSWRRHFISKYVNNEDRMEKIYLNNPKFHKNDFYDIKCVLLGETVTGKSTFFETIRAKQPVTKHKTKGRNSLVEQPARMFKFHCREKDKKEVYSISMWDISGKRKHENMVKMYTRNSQIFMVFFDPTSGRSFEVAKRKIKQIKHEEQTLRKVIVLVENKLDLGKDARVVQPKVVMKYQDEQCDLFVTISALEFCRAEIVDVMENILSLYGNKK